MANNAEGLSLHPTILVSLQIKSNTYFGFASQKSLATKARRHKRIPFGNQFVQIRVLSLLKYRWQKPPKKSRSEFPSCLRALLAKNSPQKNQSVQIRVLSLSKYP